MLATAKKIQPSGCRKENIAVLLVSPDCEDRSAIREILGNQRCRILHVADCRTAQEQLPGFQPCVVVCDRDASEGGWKQLLRAANLCESKPAVVVVSRCADEGLWADVLNEGGYDVLAKPFEPAETCRILQMAYRNSIARRPVRSERAASVGMVSAYA